MQGKRSIKEAIYRAYLKASLFPIFIIELALLVMYFSITGYLANSTKQTLQQEASEDLIQIVVKEAKNINLQFETITRFAQIVQSENERLFNEPRSFGSPSMNPVFDRAQNGVVYKKNDNGGSSLWYSAKQPFSADQRQKAVLTEGMDPLFKAIQKADSNIVGIYFNSWDSMNRYYPFLPKVFEVYEPRMDIPIFNFYYLADKAHNPKGVPVWTDAYLDPAGQGWMASCIVPIYRGRFLEGVTGIDMTIDTIVKNILGLDLPWGGSAFLVDGSGVILAMPEKVEEVLGLKELRSQVYTDHVRSDTVKPEEFNVLKNKDPAIAKQMASILATDKIVEELKMADKEYLITCSTIPKTGWHFMVLVDKAVINAPVAKHDILTDPY